MGDHHSPTFDKLASLPLEIESCSLQGLSKDVSSGFVRATTIVHLHGGGEQGVGEDVIYDAAEQAAFQRTGAPELKGSWTLTTFGDHVDTLDLFASKPFYVAFRAWRRWAFHSAALDLALRQSGRALHDVLGIEPSPVAFVVSRRLGEPASTAGLRGLMGRYPDLRLKLDATDTWDQLLIDELATLDALETVDFKGYSPDGGHAYPSDAQLYRRVAESLPHVWLEDPRLGTPEADAALAPYTDRITWDQPVRSVADIEALVPTPLMINIKPSRFGSLRELCAAYDFCAEHGIGVYAGGQFELGPGRGQIQYLASLFHPRAPNDIAPAAYNDTILAEGLPTSPLPVAPTTRGFSWEC